MKVLRPAWEGDDLQEIAARLHPVRDTVGDRLGAILTELDARNRLDAVRLPCRRGWWVTVS